MPVTQETKQKILSVIKKVMLDNCPPLVIKSQSENGIEIIGNAETTYGYKKQIIPGMYFASALIRKDNVSFYFFPCYMNLKDFEKLAPVAIKYLDGKTCFHFKKEEQVIEKEISALMKKGIEFYTKQGWVK